MISCLLCLFYLKNFTYLLGFESFDFENFLRWILGFQNDFFVVGPTHVIAHLMGLHQEF